MPNLQRKLPLSLQFYLKAVNKDISRDIHKMIKNGIGKDPRVYYRDFLKKLLAENRKIKASEIEKFMTDNILEVKKNQQMNEKCLTFMQGSLQATKCKNEEEKETFMQ